MSSHVRYDPVLHLEPTREMMRRGATVLEVADHLGVSVASVEAWGVCHEDFADALRVGKELADDRVERALFNRCVGYTFDSEKVMVVDGQVVHEPTREHAPPDTGAALKWLINRRPDRWRDKREFESDGKVTVTIKRIKIDGPAS